MSDPLISSSDRSATALKWGAIIAGSIFALALAYAAFWFTVATQVRSGIEGWIEARRADGYSISLTGLEIGGFPFLIRARIAKPAVFAPADRDAWQWEAPSLTLEARPWDLMHIWAHLPGAHRIAVGTGSRQLTVTVGASVLDAEAVIVGGRVGKVRVTAETLAVERSGSPLGRLERIEVAAVHDPSEDADYHTATAILDLTVTGLTVERSLGIDLPFGAKLRQVALKGRIMGRIPPGPRAESLALWRDGGGTAEIERLDLGYGPLHFLGSGTVALDGLLQPVGAFNARIEGFFDAVDALRRRGVIRERDALTAKLVLGALAKKGNGDGAPTLSVPLTVQERRLYVGPLPLLHLPEVHW